MLFAEVLFIAFYKEQLLCGKVLIIIIIILIIIIVVIVAQNAPLLQAHSLTPRWSGALWDITSCHRPGVSEAVQTEREAEAVGGGVSHTLSLFLSRSLPLSLFFLPSFSLSLSAVMKGRKSEQTM